MGWAGHTRYAPFKPQEAYERSRMAYLIRDTTREEREKIVAESLGNISASCDGCSAGVAEMYQPYIDGLKELSEINREFHGRYVSGDK